MWLPDPELRTPDEDPIKPPQLSVAPPWTRQQEAPFHKGIIELSSDFVCGLPVFHIFQTNKKNGVFLNRRTVTEKYHMHPIPPTNKINQVHRDCQTKLLGDWVRFSMIFLTGSVMWWCIITYHSISSITQSNHTKIPSSKIHPKMVHPFFLPQTKHVQMWPGILIRDTWMALQVLRESFAEDFWHATICS